MPRVNIANFDKLPTDNILPVGAYEAIVSVCEYKTTKKDGTPAAAPFIQWEFTIQGPTNSGRKYWEVTGVGEYAWATKKMVVGCGVTFTPDGFNTEDCLGRRVQLVIGQKIDKNTQEPMNKIDKISVIA
jgi:hypothetical protein